MTARELRSNIEKSRGHASIHALNPQFVIADSLNFDQNDRDIEDASSTIKILSICDRFEQKPNHFFADQTLSERDSGNIRRKRDVTVRDSRVNCGGARRENVT